MTTIGTGGTFKLWPHMTEVPAASGALVPEQLNTTTRSVGTVRLYAEDVRNLVNEISRDFTQNRVVITYPDKGGQKNIYSDQFEVSLQNLPEIRYLKLSIQEPELYGINRMAMIELSAWGEIGRAHVELQSLMRISYAVFCLKKKIIIDEIKHKISNNDIRN